MYLKSIVFAMFNDSLYLNFMFITLTWSNSWTPIY